MLSVITLQNSKRNMKTLIGIVTTKEECQTIQTMRKINKVSLVERGGLRLSFFLLGSEAQKWSSQVLKTKDSQARFCFVKFFRVAKMSHLVTFMSQSNNKN